MPSPFPGMDPYLEDTDRWPDVHHRLITYIAGALQPQVQPRYHVRIRERVYTARLSRAVYPEKETDEDGVKMPVHILVTPVERREGSVEIVHTAGDAVVTVIEVLSPDNKKRWERRPEPCPEPCRRVVEGGYRLYCYQLDAIFVSPIHMVEIDLLAEGQPPMAIMERVREALAPHRYLVSVNRGPDHDQSELYPTPLQRRLPHFSIPLREPDADVGLDLQAVFTQCYDSGDYATLVDYGEPPVVTLSPEEAAWVDRLLEEKGLRGGESREEVQHA